jgi:hypothetical protein
MNDDSAYLPILRRVGLVLIVVGVIDVGLMIYCIVHDIHYSSPYNIFAIIAGIFLLRGSLRGAALISQAAALLLAFFIVGTLLLPVFVPVGLVLAGLRIYPLRVLADAARMAFFLGLSFWVFRQLRREVVLQASVRSKGRIPSLRVPILIGVALVAILASTTSLSLRSDRAKRAEQIAASQVGDGYNLHVTSIGTTWTSKGGGRSYAVVTAWNDHEIRKISVSWDEQ